jgi:methylated-DNA-[protein]-cysteine S-methyltransferase
MPAATAFTIFDTTAGSCAVAWHDAALTGVELPSDTLDATRAECLRRWAGTVESTSDVDPTSHEVTAGGPGIPAFVHEAVAGIRMLLAGGSPDLSRLPLDLSAVPAFHQRVYEVTCAIVQGRTRTYGEVAAAVSEPGAARAVGQALGRNPFPLIIPCHRVLAAGGRPGGFSGAGGVATKRRLLAIEGAGPAQGVLPGF